MADKKDFDVSIIRPEMRFEHFRWRREGRSGEELKGIKRGLRTLQTLETMAVNIYKFQITRRVNELNLYLLAAMGNEMTHLQDFQIKLFEYGFKPSKFRVLYWIVGVALGFISRTLGTKAILTRQVSGWRRKLFSTTANSCRALIGIRKLVGLSKKTEPMKRDT